MADALSRLDNSDNAQVNILQLKSIQLDPALILKDIHSKQQTDPFCSRIIAYLSQNILSSNSKDACKTITWSRFMTIKNNLLFNIFGLVLQILKKNVQMY